MALGKNTKITVKRSYKFIFPKAGHPDLEFDRTGHDRHRMDDEAMRLGPINYFRNPSDEQCLPKAIRLACGKTV